MVGKWVARSNSVYEEYTCGCISAAVGSKKGLLGYCPKHGADRRYIHGANGRLDPEAAKKVDAALREKEAK